MSEHRFRLNTGNGQSKFITDILDGQLECVLVRCPQKVSMAIVSEIGYTLYRNPEVVGNIYVCLRTRKINEEGHGYDDGDKFYLNERLILYVNGPKNLDVEIILRTSQLYNTQINI